jgi:hypothetical protein
MSDRHDLLDLPILDELGAELARAFRAAEADEAPARPTPSSVTPSAAGAPFRAGRTPAPPSGRPPRRRPARLTRWAAVAAATAVAIGGVAVLDPWGGSGLGPAAASAAEVLRRAAGAAERDLTPALPRADQYAYTDIVSLDSATTIDGSGRSIRDSTEFALTRTRTWSSVGRPSVAVSRTLRKTPLGALPPALTLGPQELEATGPTPSNTPRRRPGTTDANGDERTPLGRDVYHLGAEELGADDLRAYPTDAAAILRRLRVATAGQSRSPNGALWVAINDALRETPLTPPLRAGLYRALAALPGVRLDGETTDRLGRRAVSLSYQEPGTWERETLLLDARTYGLLGTQEVVAANAGSTPRGVAPTTTTVERATVLAEDDPRPAYPAGTVTSESLVLHSGVTDSAGEAPADR